MSTLSASERARGRGTMLLYQGMNTIAYSLVSGNIVTLYALHLGATSLFIGVIGSIPSLSYLFMFAGRELAGRFGTRGTMSWGWVARYTFAIPLLVSPLLVAGGNIHAGLTLIVLGLLGFHIARGIGIIGFNPVTGILSEGRDRGVFLSRIQLVNQLAAIALGLAMAAFLGAEVPLSRYALFMAIGVVTGYVSCILVFRLPNPDKRIRVLGAGLGAGAVAAIKRTSFRRFIILFFFVAVALGMAGAFLVVYAKRVYTQTDNIIMLITVAGNLGAAVMALVSGFLIDRLGAKPLYIFFAAFVAASVLPMAVAPRIAGVAALVFLCAIFFFFQLGSVGAQNAAQNYFFAIISPEEFLNLGILYNLFFGIGAAVGSLFGGGLLDFLRNAGVRSTVVDFRIFYLSVFVLMLVLLVFVARLTNVGRYTVRNAMNIIFSPRDLRAVALLNRLERSHSIDEEVDAIRALAASRSEVPVEDLLQKLHHPRFYVRQQALRALEDLPADKQVTRALINEVKNHKFTTAYIAARIIGRKGLLEGTAELRRSIESDDYLLAAYAMLALARLGDAGSIPLIERAMQRTRNPLVLIHAATALDVLKSEGSIPLLMEVLKLRHSPPYLRDEIILSIAGILGIADWFYPHYAAYLERARSGGSSLMDYLDEKYQEQCGVPKALIKRVISLMYREPAQFSRESVNLLVQLSSRKRGPENLVAFIEAAVDPDLVRFERFCFLVSAILVWSAC